MKLHLQTDQHLEFRQNRTVYDWPARVADVFVIAGDLAPVVQMIRPITDFFKAAKDQAEHVIWVLGNHEFYYGEYHEVLDEAFDIAEKTGVILLDLDTGNPEVDIDGVKFWGTTFWTDLHKNDWFVKQTIKKNMNDVHIIDYKDHLFNTDVWVEKNMEARKAINWDADVIITHHNPIVAPNRRFEVSNMTYGFCNTGLDNDIIDWDGKYWLYGHTHDTRVDTLGGTQVVCNCYGYERGQWKEDTQYNPNLILEV